MKKEFDWNVNSVGYWSALAGVEVKEVVCDEELDIICYCVSGAWTDKPVKHRVKVQSNNKGEYIRINGLYLYFDECMRIF